jgi:excisionase family DNA binding protein
MPNSNIYHAYTLTSIVSEHMNIEKPVFLTEVEAADYLGVAPITLNTWRWQKKKSLKYIKLGKYIKYRKADLDAFLEECVVVGNQ